MRQQQYEDALKAIVKTIEELGSTTTYNPHGDRQRTNRALYEVVKLARTALEEPPVK